MVKYTELEDILKHAEVGDTIHLKSPKVYGDNCGEITIVDEDEDEDVNNGYNLWFKNDGYGNIDSDETIEDLIYGYYDAYDGNIELIKGSEYVHIYSKLVDVMKEKVRVGYFIEVSGDKYGVGEIVYRETELGCGYTVRFGEDDYGDDYPYTDLKQLIQEYYDTWHGKISLLVPKKKEENPQKEYKDLLTTTENYVAREIYKQFLIDDPVGFQQVRKQILKNKEVTYFKGE